LGLGVRALVGGVEGAAAVLLGTGDPAEAGVELLGLPVLGRAQLFGLLVGRLLVEDPDPVGPFTPDELLLGPRLGPVAGRRASRDE